MACSTVMAAGAAGAAVALWPGPAAAQQAAGITADRIGQTTGAASPASPAGSQDLPGRAITTYETRHANSVAAQQAQARAAAAARVRAAAAARAAARVAAARAAQQQAAQQQAAQQQAAQQQATQQQAVASSPPAQPATAVASGSPQQIATSMLGSYGWSSSQFSCLDQLWNRESGWNPTASNPSGAYGIPQALPGSKMASAGADWATNPATQIKWGLGYIKSLYGSPCGAWSHEEASGWY
ncbi:MAG TPA: transglycosylase SLT domain-containing protein [Streptosporangiaceae bacterium]